MRLLHTLMLSALLPCLANANSIADFNRQFFIENYAKLAVEEMARTGIPASITLAQAILESNWGQGTVAREGNNFFCIKCNNGWQGPFVEAPDDETGLSCFRAYSSIEESFFDHSNFLSVNLRYRKLFQYKFSDYQNWARGLQECGYATDTVYAEKLIRLIEDHGLYIYDYAVPAHQIRIMETAFEAEPEAELIPHTPVVELNELKLLPNVTFDETVLEVPGYRLNEIASLSKSQNDMVPDRIEVNEGKRNEIVRPLLPRPDHQLVRR